MPRRASARSQLRLSADGVKAAAAARRPFLRGRRDRVPASRRTEKPSLDDHLRHALAGRFDGVRVTQAGAEGDRGSSQVTSFKQRDAWQDVVVATVRHIGRKEAA